MDRAETHERDMDSCQNAMADRLSFLELCSDQKANGSRKEKLSKADASTVILPDLAISDLPADKRNEVSDRETVARLDSLEKQVQDLVAKQQPSQSTRFVEYSNSFKTRSTAQGLSTEEQLATYSSLRKMLEAGGDGPVMNESSRSLMAVEFMYHAADPSTIDQGDWDTCGVTTIEERMFAKHPSRVADMVQQVALTGEWKAADGKMINVGDKTVLSLWAPVQHPPLNGDRTLVSNLFQVTALNDIGQRGELGGFEGKNVHYMEANGASLVLHEGDDQAGAFQGISSQTIQMELNRLSGETIPHVLINSAKDHDANKNVIHFKSQEQLSSHLQELKDSNDLPAILSVCGSLPPFNAPYSQGHVVSISDIRQAANGAAEVYVDNQWGKGDSGCDGWYPLNEIFKSTSMTS